MGDLYGGFVKFLGYMLIAVGLGWVFLILFLLTALFGPIMPFVAVFLIFWVIWWILEDV